MDIDGWISMNIDERILMDIDGWISMDG
jgi:hypothetical protein